MKPTDRRRAFLDPSPHLAPRAEVVPSNRRFGHLPSRIHLRRGYRLRGRLVRFASHRRKSAAG